MPNPRVTILLPVLDEATFIDACLGSLAAQDYPGEIEIIVADGGSSDGTPEMAREWNEVLPLMRVIPNPYRIQSHGLNLAAEEATGEILVRADAHTAYAPDYVRRSVEALLETGAVAVGGPQIATAPEGFAKGVADAMRIPLAVGPARFRHAQERGDADTVYLGAFRKSDWERLGGWRTLPSGVAEDADFYYRWRQQGARVMIDPGIVSSYRPRDTLGRLWRQFYRYGLGKADMLYVNGRWPSWRPIAPLLLVVALAAGMVLGLLLSWWPLIAVLVVWLSAIAIAAKGSFLAVVATVVMHLAYGLGLTRGLARIPSSVRSAVS